MNKIKILGLGLGLMLYATLSLAAVKGSTTKLYKWVDDNGETHYGEVIPPEYADREKTQISGKSSKDKDKLQKTGAESAVKTPEQQAAIDQRRKDQALMNTYSNEKEIDLARGRNLQQVVARINSIEMQLKSANDRMNGYNLEQTNLKKAGKAIPESVQSDVADAQKRVATLEIELKEAQDKAAAVRATFDAYKTRFHELSTGTAK